MIGQCCSGDCDYWCVRIHPIPHPRGIERLDRCAQLLTSFLSCSVNAISTSYAKLPTNISVAFFNSGDSPRPAFGKEIFCDCYTLHKEFQLAGRATVSRIECRNEEASLHKIYKFTDWEVFHLKVVHCQVSWGTVS